VQAYYFSFPNIRSAATKNKSRILAAEKELFSDNDFIASNRVYDKKYRELPHAIL
jgi:hypothetical protein